LYKILAFGVIKRMREVGRHYLYGHDTIPSAKDVITNFLLRCRTSTPPAPVAKGGARKVSVASIEEIGIRSDSSLIFSSDNN
jgi:hypothetical protein